MAKCHFVTKEVIFFGRPVTTNGVTAQRQKITYFLYKVNFARFNKELQQKIGFLNYYRNYITRLTERLNPSFQLLKTTENKRKIIITPELLNEIREIDDVLDKCCQLALRQPLPDKQLLSMTDEYFQATGYAVLTEDDPNQKFTSTRKTYAPAAYGSKTSLPYNQKCPCKPKNS